MDLRIERARRNIINAFLQLRAKKPIEKITVTELAETAVINKATFYLHYCRLTSFSQSLQTNLRITLDGTRFPVLSGRFRM